MTWRKPRGRQYRCKTSSERRVCVCEQLELELEHLKGELAEFSDHYSDVEVANGGRQDSLDDRSWHVNVDDSGFCKNSLGLNVDFAGSLSWERILSGNDFPELKQHSRGALTDAAIAEMTHPCGEDPSATFGWNDPTALGSRSRSWTLSSTIHFLFGATSATMR